MQEVDTCVKGPLDNIYYFYLDLGHFCRAAVKIPVRKSGKFKGKLLKFLLKLSWIIKFLSTRVVNFLVKGKCQF